MSLSDANLRYLFALSELAGQGRPVRSMEVADLDDIEACVALTAAFAQAKLEA